MLTAICPSFREGTISTIYQVQSNDFTCSMWSVLSILLCMVTNSELTCSCFFLVPCHLQVQENEYDTMGTIFAFISNVKDVELK